MEGEGVQVVVVLQQLGAVQGKEECQEDSHLLQLQGHCHDRMGTYLLSYRILARHSLCNVSLVEEVFHKNYGPPGLHGTQTSFQ